MIEKLSGGFGWINDTPEKAIYWFYWRRKSSDDPNIHANNVVYHINDDKTYVYYAQSSRSRKSSSQPHIWCENQIKEHFGRSYEVPLKWFCRYPIFRWRRKGHKNTQHTHVSPIFWLRLLISHSNCLYELTTDLLAWQSATVISVWHKVKFGIINNCIFAHGPRNGIEDTPVSLSLFALVTNIFNASHNKYVPLLR